MSGGLHEDLIGCDHRRAEVSQTPDYFSDILLPGEVLVALLGGSGPTVERATGVEHTWFQLGLTGTRLLVVRLVQPPLALNYQPVQRIAVAKELIAIARFPRTPSSVARLEIRGCGDLITLLDIDSEKIFPLVEPFLLAWGGPVDGSGTVAVREADPYDAPHKTETGKLFLLAGAIAVILWLCCGCSGIGLIVKNFLHS